MNPNPLRRLLDTVLKHGPLGIVALALVVALVALLSGAGAGTIIALAVLLLVVALLLHLAGRPGPPSRPGRDA